MIKQTMEYYKSMYKYELADAAGVSMFTFRRWLEACEEDVIRLGYKKTQKFLTPIVVKFLCEKYGITFYLVEP